MKRWLRIPLKAIAVAALVALALLLAWAFESRNMAPLEVWHTVVLEGEFRATDATPQTTLNDYVAREEQLFRELQQQVYDRVASGDALVYNRYRAGGPQDPAWPQRNWNRTFELVPERIVGGALLMHGLTDSPYSLRRIGEILYARGYYVVGLRLPGHGTAPGELTRVRWEDWVAASRIGARHVRKQIGAEPPLVIAGYSNGGGLAVKYALDALADADLPVPDQLLLFSPEIGIAPIARISNSHALLSGFAYFEQFKWLSIEPEYDPFKYNSFPKNAAQEAWEVTAAIQRRIQEMHEKGRFTSFPNTLTFLSGTDATVETSATVERLYDRLESEGSELVIFDVNRFDELAPWIPAATDSPLERLEASTELPYRLTVITNRSPDTAEMMEKSRAPRAHAIESRPLRMAWPKGVYSLAHVAIPFSPDDPVYGAGEGQHGSYSGLRMGALQPRGETHLLIAPVGQLMRLRHNPFFDYVERRVIEVVSDL